jgi:cytoskeleton protein RodZ
MSETIGQILKKAREAQQISLEEAFQATHIRLRFLEALENDQRLALPSDVQGRGFLRMYADYLGIPSQPLLDLWPGHPVAGIESKVRSGTHQTPVDRPDPSTGDETDVVGAPQAQTIYNEIGAQLRQRRETLSLTLTDVERYTHVRMHYLKALEDGRMDLLPSTVQGRGMLKNYAVFLEMDTDLVLLNYADGLQTQRIENLRSNDPIQTDGSQERTPQQPIKAPAWKRLITPDLLFGGTVILMLLIVTIWSIAQVSSRSETDQEPTAPSVSDVLLNTPPTPTQDSLSTITPSPESGEDLPTETIDLEELGGDTETNPAAGLTQPAAAVDIILTATVPFSSGDPLQLYVVASQRAWVRVIADNEIIFNSRVVPGNAYPFSGTQQIELVTGNAAAINIIFNQEDLGTLGIVGQVARIVFTGKGIRTPTLDVTITPTPTETLAETPTPTPNEDEETTITPLIPQ